MNKINFIFLLVCSFLLLSCEAQQNESTEPQDPDRPVNLSDSKGCEGEKSDQKSDDVSFAQNSSTADESVFDEDKESDSGCSL